MNRIDRSFASQQEAVLRYLDGEFAVLKQGGFVRCAVTGQPIGLDELRYWSVARQEAYVSPEASLARHRASLGEKADR